MSDLGKELRLRPLGGLLRRHVANGVEGAEGLVRAVHQGGPAQAEAPIGARELCGDEGPAAPVRLVDEASQGRCAVAEVAADEVRARRPERPRSGSVGEDDVASRVRHDQAVGKAIEAFREKLFRFDQLAGS